MVTSQNLARNKLHRFISFSRKNSPSPSTQDVGGSLVTEPLFTPGISSTTPSNSILGSGTQHPDIPFATSPSFASLAPNIFSSVQPTPTVILSMRPSNESQSALWIPSASPSLFPEIILKDSLNKESEQLSDIATISSTPSMVPSTKHINRTKIESMSPSSNSANMDSADEGDKGFFTFVDGDQYPSYFPILSLAAILSVGILCCALLGLCLVHILRCCNGSSSQRENLPSVSSSASESTLNAYPVYVPDESSTRQYYPVKSYVASNSFLPQFSFF